MRKTIDLDGGMDTEIMNASIFGQQGFLGIPNKPNRRITVWLWKLCKIHILH